MEYIHSKDIFLLMRDTLKLVDRRVMDHGSRVAYYLYKMLECKGGYEKFELADFVFLASLHDIGAYKTDFMKNMLYYEGRDTMAHSTYGYLFFKYLSPLSELAGIILHHHTDYVHLKTLNFEYKDIVAYLNLAEKVDIYAMSLGEKFNIQILKKQAGTVFSENALKLFEQAVTEFDVMNKVKRGEYKEELDDIIEYMIFTNEDKKKYLEMLMYCRGFRSEASVVDAVTCLCIAEGIGERLELPMLEREQLYYGTLLHDIGMLAIPSEIVLAPRTLTQEEIQKVRMHVHLAEKVLKNRMAEEVIGIVAAHHERGDGSGYPRGLREILMSRNQQILQIADTVTGMINKRPYKRELTGQEIERQLKEAAAKGKYNKVIVKIFLGCYKEIMDKVNRKSEEIMMTYKKLNNQYKQVSGKFQNYTMK